MAIMTQERLKQLMNYDPATGRFLRLYGVRGKRRDFVGARQARGSIQISIGGHLYQAHRLAWLYAHGEWPTHTIDHINGDPSDNRLCNLRDVPIAVNNENLKQAKTHSKTGVLGVRFWPKSGKFQAVIRKDGLQRNLGSFESAELAHNAYVLAKRALHVGCTI